MSQTAPRGTDAPVLSVTNQPAVLAQQAPQTPVPANPAAILAAQSQPKPKTNRVRAIALVAGGMIIAQLLLPSPMTPAVIIASVVGDFQAIILKGIRVHQRAVAECERLAQSASELSARRSEALGSCEWVGLAGQEYGGLCKQLVRAKFDAALAEVRHSLDTTCR